MPEKISKMFDEPHEVVGWLGITLILGAYSSINFGFVGVESIWYQLANATGAVALIYNTLKTGAYPVTLLNIVWLLVALSALLQTI